jgi:hypothetical protein
MFIEKDITLLTGKGGGPIGGRIDLAGVIDGTVEGAFNELSGAIFEEMTEIINKSKEIVPKRFGELQSSADAVGVNLTQTGSHGAIVIGYGGAASAYTFIQHQTPPPDEAGEGETAFRHAPGRMWKFLEKPVLEATEGMEGRIADRIRRRLAAG